MKTGKKTRAAIHLIARLQLLTRRKQEIFDEVNSNQSEESFQRLGVQKSGIGNQVKMMETAAGEIETLLKHGTSANIVQLD